MATTDIEWSDVVWNPVRGCSKVSAGCTNCYAMKQAHRFSGPGQPYEGLTRLVRGKGPQWTGAVRTVPEMLDRPLRWRKPRRVFVNSMSDLFHDDVPDEFIAGVWAVMSMAPRHTFQILTKRPERLPIVGHAMFRLMVNSARLRRGVAVLPDSRRADGSYAWPLPNVWLGTSVEDQAAADERIPHLLRTPAAVRFLSCEPLLGPVDLARYTCGECGRSFSEAENQKVTKVMSPCCEHCDEHAGSVHVHWLGRSPSARATNAARIHWVIAGGESGPGARPCDVAWIRSLVEQCRAAGVACFTKQLGAQPYEAGQDYAARIPIGVECEHGYDVCPKCDAKPVALELEDRKGGDPSEWPSDLRVREFPQPMEVTT